mgnify:CR=1 FL=1
MTSPFDEDHHHRKPGLFAGFRASFLTGIVVIAPVGMTIWLVWTMMGWVDSVVLPLVPSTIQPEKYIGINLRGVGVIIFLIFTVFIGWIAKGLIGRSMISFGERLVDRMPDMLARAAMGLGKNGVPNRDRCAVAALCRGAALQALGRSSEARQCFEWSVAKCTRITKDR